MLGNDVARKYVVRRSQITSWEENIDVIVNAVAGDDKKRLVIKN